MMRDGQDTIAWEMTSPYGARLVIAVHGKMRLLRRNNNQWQCGTYMNHDAAAAAALEETSATELTNRSALTHGPVTLALPTAVSKELQSTGVLTPAGAALIALALNLTD